MKEISLKNENTFLTLLVALGHLAIFIPKLIGKELKGFIVQTVYKEILMRTSFGEATKV